MLTCKRCGSESNENSKFCSQCGAKLDLKPELEQKNLKDAETVASDRSAYCGKCGAKLPEGCEFCLICGTKAGEAPAPDPEPGEPLNPEPSFSPVPASQRHSKRLAAVGIGICVVLAVFAVSTWLIGALPYLTSSGKTRAKSAIIYSTADKLLKFKSPSIDVSEILTDDYIPSNAANAAASPNGRYIAYVSGPENNANLFLRDFGKSLSLDPSNQSDVPVILSDNATRTFFFTSDSSNLIFLTKSGYLYRYDFSEFYELDSGSIEVIDYSDTQILYTKTDSGSRAIIILTLATGSKVEIDESADWIYDYTPSFDRLIYTRITSDGEADIIAYDAKSNTVRTLAVGSGEIISADAKSFTVLYQAQTSNMLKYENIINDDTARQDEKIEEPSLEDYPLLDEFFSENNLDTDEAENVEKENPEDSEELAEQRAKFYEALDVFDKKRERDKLREQIKTDIDAFVSGHPVLYDLHLCRDGVTTRLAEGSYKDFDTADLDIDKGFVIWSSSGIDNPRKITLSEYYSDRSQIPSFVEFLTNSITESLNLQQFGYVPTQIALGNGKFTFNGGWQLTEKGDGIYFAAENQRSESEISAHASLYYAPIQSGSADGVTLVDEQIDGIGGMLSGNRLIYFKDKSGGDDIPLCDMYILDGSVIEKIGTDVAVPKDYLKIVNSGKTLLYCEHFDTSNQSGTLFMMTKLTRQLATDVRSIYYQNDSLVYFLRGSKDGNAALYAFGNDGLKLIDENITAVME